MGFGVEIKSEKWVSTCRECPFRKVQDRLAMINTCRASGGKSIDDIDEIPEWCNHNNKKGIVRDGK